MTQLSKNKNRHVDIFKQISFIFSRLMKNHLNCWNRPLNNYETSIKELARGKKFRERYAKSYVSFIFHFCLSSSIYFQQGFDEVVDSRDILQSSRRRKARLSWLCFWGNLFICLSMLCYKTEFFSANQFSCMHMVSLSFTVIVSLNIWLDFLLCLCFLCLVTLCILLIPYKVVKDKNFGPSPLRNLKASESLESVWGYILNEN